MSQILTTRFSSYPGTVSCAGDTLNDTFPYFRLVSLCASYLAGQWLPVQIFLPSAICKFKRHSALAMFLMIVCRPKGLSYKGAELCFLFCKYNSGNVNLPCSLKPKFI
jgi:hypothetical protein